jgi:hypothetical protein
MTFVDQHMFAFALPLCNTPMVVGDGKMTKVGDPCYWVILRIFFVYLLLTHRPWKSGPINSTQVVPYFWNVGLMVYCVSCCD